MSPLPSPTGNGSSHESPFTSVSGPTGPSDALSTVVFGILALIASIVTIWQGHRAWKIWQDHYHHQHPADEEQSTCIITLLILKGDAYAIGSIAQNPNRLDDY
ncbi:hypothetical protein MMC12_003278 [Toensbergia leucococca]|nr:hypothetical protein [Toensbergia leucococca]